jgi:C1A family cysteine protease
MMYWEKIKKLFRRKNRPSWGLIPDKKDKRDFRYKVTRTLIELPVSTERKNISAFPWRYDQGSLGSCVGQGISEAFRRTLQVTEKPDFDPSRLFAYWISREDKLNDTGASIRDGFKAMNRDGLCSEKTWPYIINKFADTPHSLAFFEAAEHQTITYESIYPVTKNAIMDAVSRGFPVVYGKNIYSSFMTDRVKRTGEVPMPRKCRDSYLGGHCMVIFDYDQDGTVELNSWGSGWGDGGVAKVPWEYVLKDSLCRDFWVIYLTEG